VCECERERQCAQVCFVSAVCVFWYLALEAVCMMSEDWCWQTMRWSGQAVAYILWRLWQAVRYSEPNILDLCVPVMILLSP